MSSESDRLLGLAGSITDEVPVDWDREHAVHPDTRDALRQLQALEKLAAFQRRGRAETAPAREPALLQWGPLRAIEKLGEGGFAEVFRAWDPVLRREVALKLRRPGDASMEGSARRWLEEARRLARVRHAHVVSIYGADVHDGRAGMWMELIVGKTLEAGLAEHGPMGAREAALVGAELCAALAAVHAAGLLHGDVKTTNVMREQGGRIVLMDFGAGSERSLGDAGGSPVTFATPLISAPEVLDGRGARVESDLYALGVLLYRLASGRMPVSGAGFDEVRRKLAAGETVPLRDARPDLPHEFVQVVSRALEPRAEDRFPTAGAMETALLRSLRAGTEAEVAPASAASASVAVLPLVNVSGDAAHDYFADGLAEELLNNLARIPGLRVAGRTSSFSFKGKDLDVREVARRLNVGAVLEGSVRNAGGRVRIAVQLIDARDGLHVWSQTYDRELGDIFAIQEDIAQSAAGALKVALLGRRATTTRTVVPEAYDASLLGRYLLRRATRPDLEKAESYYRTATELDPGFAAAWAGLAHTQIRRASHGHAPLDDGYRLARASVERALAIDPELSVAHTVLGLIKLDYDWDWIGADAAFKRAVTLDPGDAGCIGNAALLAATLGRFDEALELGRRAAEIDPLSVGIWMNQGMFEWYAGRDDAAVALYRRAMEIGPEVPLVHAKLGRVFLTGGRLEEALAEMEAEKSAPFRIQGIVMVQHARGQRQASDASLAELIERFHQGGAFQIAEAIAYRGENDRAFEWLDRAFTQRDTALPAFRCRPLMKNLAGDPRWSALETRLRLPPLP